MSKNTWIIIGVVILLAVIVYFAYVKLIKNGTETKTTSQTIGNIDCSKYWSLNSIDKQWCKSNGLAPASPNVQTDILVNQEPLTL